MFNIGYHTPRYDRVPVTFERPRSLSLTILIVVVIIFGPILCLAVLGVGLRVGLTRSNDNSNSSALSTPTVTCSTTDQYCGCPSTTPTFLARINNRNTATASSWPWMVYLTIGSRICSGFLVSVQHVITAANCVYGVDKSTITAYIGIKKSSDTNNAVIRNISKVTIPSGYSSTSNDNDIAILKLEQNVTLNSKVALCCIDGDTSSPAVGTHAVIAGWSKVSLSSAPSDSLRQAVVQVQSPSTCGLSSTSVSQFCAGSGTISTCPTDNGGPLMTSSNTSWTCSGIIIDGNSTCYTTGTYTRVSSFLNDIVNALAS